MTGQQLFGLIVSENGLFVAVFTVIITKWMTMYRDRFVFIGGALFYAVGMIMFSNMSTFWGFTAAIAVFTLAELGCSAARSRHSSLGWRRKRCAGNILRRRVFASRSDAPSRRCPSR